MNLNNDCIIVFLIWQIQILTYNGLFFSIFDPFIASLLGQSKKRAETNDIALLLKYLIAVTGLTFAACLLMSTAYK